MENDLKKTLRLFRISEAALILGLPHKTLSQWLIRKQWAVAAEPGRDDFRLSYFDVFRAMIMNDLGSSYGIPVSQAYQMVSELISGINGRFTVDDGNGGRRFELAEVMVVFDAAGTACRYARTSDTLGQFATKLATVMIRLDEAIETLDAKISAAETAAGREMGSYVK